MAISSFKKQYAVSTHLKSGLNRNRPQWAPVAINFAFYRTKVKDY